MKQARRTFEVPYDCLLDWPEDCFVQCGGDGVVFTQEGSIETVLGTVSGAIDAIGTVLGAPSPLTHYRTAFFEAFPENPSCFIRGEGSTVEEAEQDAWNQFQKYVACPEHEFERRGYTNGGGFCKHCGMFKGKAFEPSETCYRCNANTYYGKTNDGRYFCEECRDDVPEKLLSQMSLMSRKLRQNRDEEL